MRVMSVHAALSACNSLSIQVCKVHSEVTEEGIHCTSTLFRGASSLLNRLVFHIELGSSTLVHVELKNLIFTLRDHFTFFQYINFFIWTFTKKR